MTEKAESTSLGVDREKSTASTEAPTLTAGPALDALVAEKVMGLTGRQTVYAWADRKIRAYPKIAFDYCGNYELARNEFNSVVSEDGEKLQGGRSFAFPHSTDISAAWKIVERLRSLGWVYYDMLSFPTITDRDEWDDATMRVEWSVQFSRYRSPVEVASPYCETPALAICLAALKAVSPSVLSQTEEGK